MNTMLGYNQVCLSKFPHNDFKKILIDYEGKIEKLTITDFAASLEFYCSYICGLASRNESELIEFFTYNNSDVLIKSIFDYSKNFKQIEDIDLSAYPKLQETILNHEQLRKTLLGEINSFKKNIQSND